MTKRIFNLLLILLLCVSVICGCAKEGNDSKGEQSQTDLSTSNEPKDDASVPESDSKGDVALNVPTADAENKDGVIGGGDAGSGAYDDDRFFGDADEKAEMEGGYVADDAPGEDIGEVYPEDYKPDNGYQGVAGTLTAGVIYDHHGYGEWLDINWGALPTSWKLNTQNRVSVNVMDSKGDPVFGAAVHLQGSTGEKVFSAVTDYYGKAYLFYGTDNVQGAAPEKVTVYYNGKEQTMDYDSGVSEYSFTYDLSGQECTKLDLMFMVDTTGSMGDELHYLQTEVEDVINRAQGFGLDIRTSVNFYRDEGDEYVVKYYAFEKDAEKVKEILAAQRAEGGGDYPEAVHTALTNAVKEHAWDTDSIKLMFLILDAPPHENEKIVNEVSDTVKTAAAMGIRIIPVASSGVDKTTEFILRSIALYTGGTYTFLTDTSGIGGSHLPPSTESYEEEKLNDLMVRLIGEYCGFEVAADPAPSQGTTNTVNSDDVTVIDIVVETSELCDCLELFWQEGSIQYIFPGIMSDSVTVYYSDGSSQNVISALEEGHITIADLDKFKIPYYTQDQREGNFASDVIEIVYISEPAGGAEAIELFWREGDIAYYFPMIESERVTVHYSDGSSENIIDALKGGRASLADLDRFGVYYMPHKLPEFLGALDWAAVSDFYAKQECVGVKTAGFVNTEAAEEITSQAAAMERAKAECTVEYATVYTQYDAEAGVYAVSFAPPYVVLGGDQTVYMDKYGVTLLIVYGE